MGVRENIENGGTLSGFTSLARRILSNYNLSIFFLFWFGCKIVMN